MITRFALVALLATAASAPAAAQNAPATNGQTTLARAAFMQRVDAIFVSADSNKDGFASRPELEVAQTKELQGRKAAVIRQREGAFKQLDKDNNGSLTMVEFNAVVVAAPLRTDAPGALSRLDTNKDGKVSLAENRAPAMAQFDRADTNKDGTLSIAEQNAAAARQ